MSKDYYKTLGVGKSVTSDELKKAYRSLAKQYHPDHNPDNKEAENKFKEISEAYSVLNDKTKRQKYDTFGTVDGQSNFSRSSNTESFDHIFKDFGNMDDFIKQFHDMGVGSFHPRRGRNSNLFAELQISLDDAFTGKSVPFEIMMPDGGTKNLRVNIPAGVEHRTRLKLKEKGSQQNTNLPAGDLYITVHIQEHINFKRLGADLFLTKSISIIDAALGKGIEVPIIESGNVKVDIPPGIQPGHKIRLKGKGMPVMGKRNRGDCYIIISVTVPTKLTDKQKELLRQF